MGSQAPDLRVITWCESLVIITAGACLVLLRLLAQELRALNSGSDLGKRYPWPPWVPGIALTAGRRTSAA
jgi:hypothetical protein